MRVTWKKRSGWQRVRDAVSGTIKGRTLTVNGKAVNGDTVAKPAARAVGGLLLATAASAIISSLRGQDGDE